MVESEYLRTVIRANKLLTQQQKNMHTYCNNFAITMIQDVINIVKPQNKKFAKYLHVHKENIQTEILHICNVSHEPNYYQYVLNCYPPELFQTEEMVALANKQIDELESNFQSRANDTTKNMYISMYGLFVTMFKSNPEDMNLNDIKKCRTKYLDDAETFDLFADYINAKIQ